jgi:hypothetical protein
MKNRTLLIAFAALGIIVAVAPTFGLWGRYPNDKPVKADNWPQSIVKAINAHPRVYGAGSGEAGWTFYFRGNTKDVNGFLKEVAEEKGVALEAVLVPEAGTAKPDPFEKELKFDYEWSLHLDLYRDGAWIAPAKGEADAQYQKRRALELAKLPEFRAVVSIHCVGAIDPDLIKIPLPFKASVGGRLANFVQVHNQRKADLEADGKVLTSEPPTDMSAAEGPRGLFGAPSTKPADADRGGNRP